MLPWVAAYDRINYSRYLPIYWCQIKTLPETHPQAQYYLHSGEFAVQRSQDVSFSQVAVDHTIEQTLNKDTTPKDERWKKMELPTAFDRYMSDDYLPPNCGTTINKPDDNFT